MEYCTKCESMHSVEVSCLQNARQRLEFMLSMGNTEEEMSEATDQAMCEAGKSMIEAMDLLKEKLKDHGIIIQEEE